MHLDDDIYRIESPLFDNQRLEVPNGNCRQGESAALTWYTGEGEHLKWKETLENGYLMFEPMHCLTHALGNDPSVVQISLRDSTDHNQLFELGQGVTDIDILGLDETSQLEAEISAYPNSVSEILTLYIPEAKELPSKINVFDLQGRLLHSEITSTEITTINTGRF